MTEVKKSEKVGVKAMQMWEERVIEKAEASAEGRGEGKADSVLELLSDLGDIPEDIEARIKEEQDENILSRWLELAAKAKEMEEFRRGIAAN